MRQKLLLFLLLTGLSVILLGSPPPSEANVITVDGTCTLIDAIIAANTDTATGNCPAGSGADTIVLDVDVSLTGVYPGSTAIGGGQSGLPDVTSDITIQAGSANLIEGNSTNFRLVYVTSAASLTIDGLELAQGKIISPTGNAFGGAIYVDGTLDINNAHVVISDVEGDVAGGGAIYVGASGTLSLTGSDLTLNSSTGTTSSHGGSIYAIGPITNIANTEVYGTSTGSGGGIAADTIISIQDSFFGGEAQQYGGGIYVTALGSVNGGAFGGQATYGGGIAITNSFTTITQAFFLESYAVSGGALWINSTNSTTGTIDTVSFYDYCSGDDGGAVWLGTDAFVDITDSKFDGRGFSGISEWACTTILDIQEIGGSAIYSKGTLHILNTTVTEHSGLLGKNAGVIHNDNGTLVIEDSDFEINQVYGPTFAAGGAIYSTGDLTVARTRFFATDASVEENNMSKGGAIYSVGRADITDSQFIFSLALSEFPPYDNYGGAIYAEGQADITNNFFSGSVAGQWSKLAPGGAGGAVYMDVSQASTVLHNTFTSSAALNGETIYANGPIAVNGNIFASEGYDTLDDNPDCMLPGGVTGSNNLHLAGDTSCDAISSGTIKLGTHVSETNGLLQSVFGNPAIDGNPGCGLATDGLGNPRIGACDIGYHELQLDNPTPTPTLTPTLTPTETPSILTLSVSAACNSQNLEVTISSGDGPFDITASAGINTPVNGVSVGTTTINGPEKWDNLTVTETGGDTESINLGQFKCRTDERPVPLTPAHRERTTNPFPLFSWTGISNTNNYRVFVFDDKVVANRTVDIRQNSGGPTSMILSTPLPDGRLFWRVRGRQNRVWSLWSVRFTLFKDPVVPVIATTPVPTVELEQPSGDEPAPPLVPTVGPAATFPAPPNSR